MASLMLLLFETLPLAAVRYQITGGEPAMFTHHTIGEVCSIVTLADPADTTQFDVHLPPLTDTERAQPNETRPVWSFEGAQSLTRVFNLDCRSSLEDFRNCRVLESVGFGVESAEAGTLDDAVEVTLPGGLKKMLPLDDAALIASLRTRGGSGDQNNECPWPVKGDYEHGILHVFLYEVAQNTQEIIPASRIIDAELDKLRGTLERLREGNTGDPTSVAHLFTDDLWRPNATSASTATVPESPPPEGSNSPSQSGDGGGTLSGTFPPDGVTTVRAVPHRILVCTFVSLSFVGDDYTPQRPAWGVRVYPVIMVRSTHWLEGVRGAIHFVRPASTTIDGEAEASCSCEEMEKGMSTLLVTDSNEGDFPAPDWVRPPSLGPIPIFAPLPIPVLHTLPAPITFWNSMFAYYVADAHAHPTLQSTRIKMVDRSKGKARTIPGALERLGTDGKLLRRPRQGAFDNIHIAPPMKMPAVTAIAPRGVSSLFPSVADHSLNLLGSRWVPIAGPDRARWHLDRVAMAPICAHDCFHLHWRWGDAAFVTADDRTSLGFGWKGGKAEPYLIRGAPLVPPNQDVYVRFCDHRSIVYEAEAVAVVQDEWVIVCHHGAGYVTSTDRGFTTEEQQQFLEKYGVLPPGDPGVSKVDAGRHGQDGLAFLGAVPAFSTAAPSEFYEFSLLTAIESWAVFYWRNRYYVHVDGDQVTPRERSAIINMNLVLHETDDAP